jgi:hypothetical protein
VRVLATPSKTLLINALASGSTAFSQATKPVVNLSKALFKDTLNVSVSIFAQSPAALMMSFTLSHLAPKRSNIFTLTVFEASAPSIATSNDAFLYAWSNSAAFSFVIPASL